jgi:NADP-dependent 3-hydroxy acid dehydrogenase YdfG
VEYAVAEIVERHGKLDVLVANAGFGSQNTLQGGSTPGQWRDMVDTALLGPAYCVRYALPWIIEARGHVVIVSSAMGRRHVPGSLYAAAKHGVHALAENLRLELDGTGVRTTVIAPGMTRTPFHQEFPITPLEPEDVCRMIEFALDQPPHVDVNEILVRPTEQTA